MENESTIDVPTVSLPKVFENQTESVTNNKAKGKCCWDVEDCKELGVCCGCQCCI